MCPIAGEPRPGRSARPGRTDVQNATLCGVNAAWRCRTALERGFERRPAEKARRGGVGQGVGLGLPSAVWKVSAVAVHQVSMLSSLISSFAGRGRAQLMIGRVVDRLDAYDLRLELGVAPVGVLDQLELRRGRPEDEDRVRVREGHGDRVVVGSILHRPVPVARARSPVELRVCLRRLDDRVDGRVERGAGHVEDAGLVVIEARQRLGGSCVGRSQLARAATVPRAVAVHAAGLAPGRVPCSAPPHLWRARSPPGPRGAPPAAHRPAARRGVRLAHLSGACAPPAGHRSAENDGRPSPPGPRLRVRGRCRGGGRGRRRRAHAGGFRAGRRPHRLAASMWTATGTALAAAVASLVRNAFKHSRTHGHISLTTTATVDHVLIEVADECGGLPAGGGGGAAPSSRGEARRRVPAHLVRKLAMTPPLHQRGDGGPSSRVRDLPGEGCVLTGRSAAAGAAPGGQRGAAATGAPLPLPWCPPPDRRERVPEGGNNVKPRGRTRR